MGGRVAAEAWLAALDPAAYGRSRNHLGGAVTRLSPYLRHGVLSLAEVRDAVFAWLDRQGYGGPGVAPARQLEGQRLAERLICELGWRDYWQRLWWVLGDRIWSDLEPLKTGIPASDYAAELPAEIAEARTGLACIDAFAGELLGSGWLHNHARLWLASYVVHWRRVRWQAGAHWFLSHLLDADPASNNLSWQWVASSFSSKPYIFNRANLERFGGGVHCQHCPAAAAHTCPFEASYEQLQAQLFGAMPQGALPAEAVTADAVTAEAATDKAVTAELQPLSPGPLQRPLVWVHGEALGPGNAALLAYPGALAVHVAPSEGSGAWPISSSALQRRFEAQCLNGLPVLQQRGAVVAEVLALAAAHQADGVVTTVAVDPQLQRQAQAIAAALPLQLLQGPPFVALPQAQGSTIPRELGRFSRYWKRAGPLVWQHWLTAQPPQRD